MARWYRQPYTLDEITFADGTPDDLKRVLLDLINHRQRVKITYTYTQEGDRFERYGYIGVTTGNHTPIIVHNARSLGGGILDTKNITRIEPSRHHPNNAAHYERGEPIATFHHLHDN